VTLNLGSQVQCNFGIPCNQCIKRAGSATLGQELCTRQSLLAVRFNNVGVYLNLLTRLKSFTQFNNNNLDLFGIAVYEELFQIQSHHPIPGTQRESYIFWPNCCHSSLDNPLIRIQIEDFRGEPDGKTQMIISRRYTDSIIFHIPDSSTAIVKDSLPSLDLPADCSLDSGHSCNAGPFVGLHKAFSEFGKMYCENRMKLPLVCSVSQLPNARH
jgi:hypothetical protein